ncbi:MAG: phospho-sugar mutase, partial [Candidatus Gallimonas sp.]
MDYKSEYEAWRTSPVFDEETKRELSELRDEKEIEDRFYKQLSFGTGGLRGVIGAGTNRMNRYTVGKATQGLANFINSRTAEGSVAIAYDSRRMSPEFALEAALVLCANGIRTYLFESLRPTPELSFAVRYLKATAGIVVTASHNPPQYNGYKVYWSDGGQIVPPYDKQIIEEVGKVSDYAQIRRVSEDEAVASGLLKKIGQEVDDAYVAELKKTVLNPEVIRKTAQEIGIVYTPLNGTGYMPVTRVLKELGFSRVHVVPEQAQPDGNFPTLRYPNPEDPAAFTLALDLAQKTDADLVLATDPDADRLGVYVRDAKTGKYVPFTGNMSGLLIAEYELSQKRAKGLLPENPADGALITTIVSSDMAFAIGKEYGLTVIEVLTGFKYIGEQIKLFEEARERNGGKTDGAKYAYEYEFGFEESYGCLVGTHARDKDAVVAVVALCEAAAYYRSQGLTLWDQMQKMYEKYGYYRETLESVTLSGADGAKRITEIVRSLRENPPVRLGR